MCFSAQVWNDYRNYQHVYGAEVDFKAFLGLLRRRSQGEKIVIPRALSIAFKQATPTCEEELACQDLVREYDSAQAPILQEEMFEQRRRLVNAERALEAKVTKKASNDQRIATNKIADLVAKLQDLERTDVKVRHERIYSGNYCPVMTMDADGRLVVRPMRYLLRPAGMHPIVDTKFKGIYNARRDSLNGFWKGQFGNTHAVVVAESFFENVKRHRLEQRELAPGEEEKNVVLRFNPNHGKPMALACLWSHWTGAGQPDLLSFALVTDEPPDEVAAAGHDRCPIPLKVENIQTWLTTPGSTKATYDALLEDKERPYYEHLIAA